MKTIFWGQPNQTNVVKRGEWIVPQKPVADGLLNLPLTNSLENFGLGGPATLTRASTATTSTTDVPFSGSQVNTITPVLVNEARFWNATRVDHADGQDYGAGVPGIQYTGGDSGIMIEGGSTNLAVFSGDLLQWTAVNGATITDSITAAFDGVESQQLNQNGSPQAVIGQPYCGAMQVRCITGSTNKRLRMRMGGVNTPNLIILDTWDYVYSDAITAVSAFQSSIRNRAEGGTDTFEITHVQYEQRLTATTPIISAGTNGVRADESLTADWPEEATQNITIKVEVTLIHDQAGIILDAGNISISYTGTAWEVKRGTDYCRYNVAATPGQTYVIEGDFTDAGLAIRVDGAPGSTSPNVEAISATTAYIGSDSAPAKHLHGLIKNLRIDDL